MAQRGMCSDGRTPHSVVSLGGAKGGATVTLHGRGVGGQHAEAEAVAEAGADFPSLEFKSRSAGESVEPGRGGAAGAAKEARARPPPLHAVGIIGLVERVKTGLGLVPCEDALGLRDVAPALGVDLLQLGFPEHLPFCAGPPNGAGAPRRWSRRRAGTPLGRRASRRARRQRLQGTSLCRALGWCGRGLGRRGGGGG
jgi:hypothetical protein